MPCVMKKKLGACRGGTTAEAGDTVEFLFEKRGKVKVRATSRFVEGARKAKKKDWQKVSLSDFIGL